MTEREELDMWFLKEQKAKEQKRLCPICRNMLKRNAQLAHRINQGSVNRKYFERIYSEKYGNGIGKKIIHHPLNMLLTCPGQCNSSVLIDNKPEEKRRLIAEILKDIGGYYDN